MHVRYSRLPFPPPSMPLLILSLDKDGLIPTPVTGHQPPFRDTLKAKLSMTFSRVFSVSPAKLTASCLKFKFSVPSLVSSSTFWASGGRERVICLRHQTQRLSQGLAGLTQQTLPWEGQTQACKLGVASTTPQSICCFAKSQIINSQNKTLGAD